MSTRAVCVIQVRDSKFYPVVEIHKGCAGMSHNECKLERSFTHETGYATRAEAEQKLIETAKMMADEVGDGKLNFYDS